MAVHYDERTWKPNLQGLRTFSTTVSHEGLIATTKVGSGTPTLLTVNHDAGAFAITLSNTSEAQSQGLSGGDVLSFRMDKIHRMSWDAMVAGVDSVSTIVMGLASAYNATPDTTTVNAWFRMQGSVSTSLTYVETDDNTTNTDDYATGLSLTNVFQHFEIDFSAWPYVRFFQNYKLIQSTTFTMAGLTAGTRVQPYFFIDKASGTGVPALTVAEPRIDYTLAIGA